MQLSSTFNNSVARPPFSVDIQRRITFLSGFCSGMLSATATHWMDVRKVMRQVGIHKPVTSVGPGILKGYFVGLPMGAIAQGQRFGVTLFLDSWLQRCMRENALQLDAESIHYRMTSFSLSVVSASLGEVVSNPPVVVKNWQIAHSLNTARGISSLWDQGKASIFFTGVVPGVVRKGLANAIVLQTITPMQSFLEALAHDRNVDTRGKSAKAIIGFTAGSITGCTAEVITNHPDRVKTLMQTNNCGLWKALCDASRDPFRGALWAGLRKGTIRGINWGSLGIMTQGVEALFK